MLETPSAATTTAEQASGEDERTGQLQEELREAIRRKVGPPSPS